MTNNRDPILSPVPVKSLRPTQLTVGLIEVAEKRESWRKDKKKGKYLGNHMVPVVIGPKGRPYVIDHHHLARALLDEGQEMVLIQPIANLKPLSEEQFWRFLDNAGLLHPYDERGERRAYSDIPKSLRRLKDDPYRSLAGAVRRGGGYAKETRPFVEFIWADYFRGAFRPRDIRNHWERTLAEAVGLAAQRDLHFMPGWCGPA